jgi:hypothetical protein
MFRSPAVLALALSSAAVAPCAAGCNSDAVGVDACKAVEEARCQQVPNCPSIQVSPPIQYTSGSATDACIRYYDTACGHGLAVSDPGTQAVNACVAAITNHGTDNNCDWVSYPWHAPDCAWLSPPDAGDDGSSDADAGDSSASDAGDAAGG